MTDPVFDVLCVGLICADLTLNIPHHPAPDEKLRASSRLIAPGGPAAVASAWIARLGGRAAFAGLLGDDAFGGLLRTSVANAGVDPSALVTVPGHETPLAAILVKPDASRSVLSHRAAPPARFVTNPGTFPCARVVLADGHRPEWNKSVVAHARALHAPLVLDAGSFSDSVRELASVADHVVASEACARHALGDRDPADPGTDLHAAFGARPQAVVVVTLGERGLVWQSTAGRGLLPAERIHVIDTNGAGDAFHGAYALGVARGLPLHAVLLEASAAGALACTQSGAWPAARNEER